MLICVLTDENKPIWMYAEETQDRKVSLCEYTVNTFFVWMIDSSLSHTHALTGKDDR